MAPPASPVLDPVLLRPSAALLGTQIAVAAAIERHAVAGTGHDPTTLDLLLRLELAPGHRLRAAELSRQLQRSPSHVSRLLDRAEAAGLVTRAPDPTDRRAALVRATGKGRKVVAEFAPRLHRVVAGVIHRTLDGEEIEHLVGYLDRIEAAARALGPDGNRP